MVVSHEDRHEMLLLPRMGIVLQVHTSTGATPPPSLSIQREGHTSRGSQSPVNRSSAGIQA